MLGLGETTRIRKIIPKKLIFEKYQKEFTGKRKASFNEDIARITITNEVSPYSLNIEEGKSVKNIFVLKVDLKKENINPANISILSNFFEQNILFILAYGEQGKLAIYESKLFQTDYQAIDNLQIKVEGLNLDTIWENLVLAISGYEIEEDRNLHEQIEIEEQRKKLLKEIKKLDKQARRESQPKKSFEMYRNKKKLEKELEDL